LFPDSSLIAYDFATQLSLKGTILYCDLQLSKDKVGFCLSSFRLDNTTNIAQLFPDAKKTYNVNGKQVQGWFPLDFPADVLLNEVSCKFLTSLYAYLLLMPASFSRLMSFLNPCYQLVRV